MITLLHTLKNIGRELLVITSSFFPLFDSSVDQVNSIDFENRIEHFVYTYEDPFKQNMLWICSFLNGSNGIFASVHAPSIKLIADAYVILRWKLIILDSNVAFLKVTIISVARPFPSKRQSISTSTKNETFLMCSF